MSELENRMTDSSEVAELKQLCGELQRRTTLLLMGLIVLSFTLAFFVGFQVRRTGKDLDAIRPQARQMTAASEKEEPTINAFMAKLTEYGRTHPDFAPIMAKYRMNTNSTASKLNPAAPAEAPASDLKK
ncbi:MAG: hypothetical protein ABSA69_04435 [Verrucomicrobiota bacterium]|jgi:hypothetical protein